MSPINNTYRIISLTLALLMFFTSTGFSIDMHFCGDNLKSVNMLGKAKNCYELAKTVSPKDCLQHQKIKKETTGCSMDKKDCCQNRSLNLQADLTLENQSSEFTMSQQLQDFVIAYLVVLLEDRIVETDTPSFADYKPPIIPRDIPVLVQSFLL